MSGVLPSESAWLVRLSGPALADLELVGKEDGITLGRHERCDLRLPAQAEEVSRFHARFLHDEHGWRLTDLGSRWGTFVNGYRLTQGQVLPLSEGDLVRITPWTFSFSLAGRRPRGLDSVDDTNQHTIVRQVADEPGARLHEELLGLLLEAAAGIHAAEDEQQLARIVLKEACRGSGLSHAAWLRPVDGEGRIEVLATESAQPSRGALYSRTLLQTASRGVVAEMGGDSPAISESIIANRISAAICVPLMLGQTIAGYVYLDSRGGASGTTAAGRGPRPGASAFCLALGRIASLALSNLKRKDIEARHASIQADLSAGAEAQRWILPPREGSFDGLSYIGESRPGLHLGGDFFDVIPLPDGRLAITLGDVTGKGVAASVLMTTTHGFLHAALMQHGEPKRAVLDLCRFIHPRRPESKFVTLWVGVFDPRGRTLRYVDAGHGHALLACGDGSIEPLSSGGGLPIGILAESDYDEQTVSLRPGGRALIVSDGIIEQFRPLTTPEPTPEDQFGVDRTAAVLAAAPPDSDVIAALFDAVITHAATDRLADDATAVLVRW